MGNFILSPIIRNGGAFTKYCTGYSPPPVLFGKLKIKKSRRRVTYTLYIHKYIINNSLKPGISCFTIAWFQFTINTINKLWTWKITERFLEVLIQEQGRTLHFSRGANAAPNEVFETSLTTLEGRHLSEKAKKVKKRCPEFLTKWLMRKFIYLL